MSETPWILANSKPPAWVIQRAAAEDWRRDGPDLWRQSLEAVGVREVLPHTKAGQLKWIDVDGIYKDLDWNDPQPFGNALNECVIQLRREQRKRPT